MTYKISGRKQVKQNISKYKRKDGRGSSDSILPSSAEGLFSIRHTDGVRVSKPYRSALISKRQKGVNEIKVKIIDSVQDSKRDEVMERASSEPKTKNEKKGINGISGEFLKSFQFPTLVQNIAAAVSSEVNLQPEALDALQQACTDYLDGFFQAADLCKVQIVKDEQPKNERGHQLEATEALKTKQESSLVPAAAVSEVATLLL